MPMHKKLIIFIAVEILSHNINGWHICCYFHYNHQSCLTKTSVTYTCHLQGESTRFSCGLADLVELTSALHTIVHVNLTLAQ